MNLNNLMCLNSLQIFILTDPWLPYVWPVGTYSDWLLSPFDPPSQVSDGILVSSVSDVSGPPSAPNLESAASPIILGSPWHLETTIRILGVLTSIWLVIVSRPFQWAELGNMSSFFLKLKYSQIHPI